MGFYHRFIFCVGVLFVVALPSAAKPGDDLTYYPDREAYTDTLATVESGVAALLAANPTGNVRAHLQNAARKLADARQAFGGGDMTGSMGDVEQAVQQLENATAKGSTGALPIALQLAQASKQTGYEIVQCIYGFSYEGNPHIRNAQKSLAEGDTELAAGRLFNACNRYRQAVDKAKVTFQGNNMLPPRRGEEYGQLSDMAYGAIRTILTLWADYREDLLIGDTEAALKSVLPDETVDQFRRRFNRLGLRELNAIARTMSPLFIPTIGLPGLEYSPSWESYIEGGIEVGSVEFTMIGPLGSAGLIAFHVSFGRSNGDNQWYLVSW